MYLDAAKEVLTVLGGAGILVGAFAYLARTLLTHWMNKDVEKYKTDLQAEHALAIEKLRSDLRQQAVEHEIRYRRNDEKIAEHLDGIYRRLLTYFDGVSRYVQIVELADGPSKEEKLTAVQEANRAFWDYFLDNRLYVPRALFRRTREFAKKLTDIVNDFTDNLRAREEGVRDLDPHFWSKAFKAVNDESSDVFAALVDDFQKRLGVFEESDAHGDDSGDSS